MSKTSETSIPFMEVMQWTEDECRDFIEKMRWPHGPTCPKCSSRNFNQFTRRTPSKNKNARFFRCRSCGSQYTVLVGTIFERTKLPLSKWLAAIYLMCASEKGISANQLHRMLGVTYKTAWRMSHQIREAMGNEANDMPLFGIVEVDETFVGPRKRKGRAPKRNPTFSKTPVFGAIERRGTS